MILMTETDFVGHAVCDYLRDFLPKSDINVISTDLFCGEPVGAIQWALAAAIEQNIALPPIYVEHIRSLDNQNPGNDFSQLVEQLPQYPAVA